MFGKARFRDTIRRLVDMKVEEIIEGIFEELKEFITGVQPEDDVTLVVMRVKDEGTIGTIRQESGRISLPGLPNCMVY